MAQSDFTKVTPATDQSFSESKGSTWVAGASDARTFSTPVYPAVRHNHAQYYAATNPALNVINLEDDAVDLRMEFERTQNAGSAKAVLFMQADLADMQGHAALPRVGSDRTGMYNKEFGILLYKRMSSNQAYLQLSGQDMWIDCAMANNESQLSLDGDKQAMRISYTPFIEDGHEKAKIKIYISKKNVVDLSEADWDDPLKCASSEVIRYKSEIFDELGDGTTHDMNDYANSNGNDHSNNSERDPIDGAGAVLGFGVRDADNSDGSSSNTSVSCRMSVAKFEARVVNNTTAL